MEEINSQHHRGRKALSNDQKNLSRVRDSSLTISPGREASSLAHGKPAAKKRLHPLDMLAAGLSLVCLVLAVIAVENETVSWCLGLNNYQLIVSGFLLSIMNICLDSIAPTLFLLIEARFGPSTLQNYDGILRNQLISSRLGLAWRLVLSFMIALPLVLSAAYKSFTGGESAMNVNATNYVGNTSYYGIFAPLDVQSLEQTTGISLFFNATIPFQLASSPQNGVEPPVTTHTQTYGYNVLTLNNESTAILDIPQPSYISAVQALLASGESWSVTAPVFGTVATLNQSRLDEARGNKTGFQSICKAAQGSSSYTQQTLDNGYAIRLLNYNVPGQPSIQYSDISGFEGVGTPIYGSDFPNVAQPFTINRQSCQGTWSITPTSLRLLDGSCNGTLLPPKQQVVIAYNVVDMGLGYMSTLAEFLGRFSTSNQSRWIDSYMATSMAAIPWSIITAKTNDTNLNDTISSIGDPSITYEDVGLVYPVNDTVVYIRPTLRKSGLLYCVFAIQPLLTVIILGLILAFHSTPMDKNFGLISILLGVHRGSLDIFAGAALSGELKQNVKLVIDPVHDDQKGTIEYYMMLPSASAVRNRKLLPSVVYH